MSPGAQTYQLLITKVPLAHSREKHQATRVRRDNPRSHGYSFAMRLLRQTPQELVLLHRPVVLCAVLVLMTLALAAATFWNVAQAEWLKAGLGALCTFGLMAPAIWFATERVDVRFDATRDEERISTRRLSGSSVEAHALGQVKRAMVQTLKGPSDTSGAHRVALELEPGGADNRLALTTGYASGRGAEELVTRINSWLHARQGDAAP